MDVFDLHAKLVSDYSTYVQSFVTIRDERIQALVGQKLREGFLWPEALVQLNPRFPPSEPLSDLIAEKLLHPERLKTFSPEERGWQRCRSDSSAQPSSGRHSCNSGGRQKGSDDGHRFRQEPFLYRSHRRSRPPKRRLPGRQAT